MFELVTATLKELGLIKPKKPALDAQIASRLKEAATPMDKYQKGILASQKRIQDLGATIPDLKAGQLQEIDGVTALNPEERLRKIATRQKPTNTGSGS